MKLTYLNYKEPLREVEDGYGYIGTLAQTEDGEKVQCHICGELFYNLGSHIHSTHGMKAKEYREKFQLNKRTPLCSDKASEEYKKRAMAIWNNLSPDEQLAKIESMKQAAAQATKVGRTWTLEELNKYGMCPDQLVDKIRMLGEELGRSPTAQDFSAKHNHRFMSVIVRTFGSWNNAKELAGYEPLKPGTKSGQKVEKLRKFSDDELLEYFRLFYKEHGTPPTSSDWKRYYLPDYHSYLKRWGSIKAARKAAGIPETL